MSLLPDENPEKNGDSPAADWDRAAASRALDELFSLTRQYKSSDAYHQLIKFVTRFRYYSPFNAMLVHVQMPGAVYVAPPRRWLRDHRHRLRAGARPLVVLQPMGPVMFVFDVSDTEPEPDAPPLPPEIKQPFEVRGGKIGGELHRTIDNALRDGAKVTERQAGSQSAGEISRVKPGETLDFVFRTLPQPESVRVPFRYQILINGQHAPEGKYATLTHELGHLYCGHIGTPNDKWWPDRRGVSSVIAEFEAESVCYLVCARLGIDNPSETYLSGYMKEHGEVPPISLDCVMKAAGLIEQMGREQLKPRKEK